MASVPGVTIIFIDRGKQLILIDAAKVLRQIFIDQGQGSLLVDGQLLSFIIRPLRAPQVCNHGKPCRLSSIGPTLVRLSHPHSYHSNY